ncbi:hypothetical protein UY3_01947 [Chelonia mydas]|uniref:Uncharacterized protein n=1 Tax=Chelonia mydas TaxID=8469 RepID=M7BSJ1_CHEMY|nr:hypothetical protein UY3_01947 [Chelonia mydas]
METVGAAEPNLSGTANLCGKLQCPKQRVAPSAMEQKPPLWVSVGSAHYPVPVVLPLDLTFQHSCGYERFGMAAGEQSMNNAVLSTNSMSTNLASREHVGSGLSVKSQHGTEMCVKVKAHILFGARAGQDNTTILKASKEKTLI